MKNIIIYSLLIITICGGSYLKFHKNHENIPIGCDEFGYMNLAKAIHHNKEFKDHVSRPYLIDLIKILRDSGYSEQEIDWLLVPHSYYVAPHSYQIFNQYAPGTSYILSVFPVDSMKLYFTPIAILLLLVIPLITLFKVTKTAWGWPQIILFIFTVFITLTSVFLVELTRINSLAFTFGLLLSAGIMLKHNSLISCLLIAISANFRIVNLLLLLPLIAFINLPITITLSNIINWIKTGFKYLLITLFALSPYLIYVYRLKGNPFLNTYSSIDTTSTFDFGSNMKFYFNLNSEFFIYHLILIGILLYLLMSKKINTKTFLAVLLFPLLNYTFFITHKMQINYYPYGSIFIVFGFLLSSINKSIKPYKAQIIIAILALFVLIDGILKFKNQTHETIITAKQSYKELNNFNIVWGDLIPSASDFVWENSAFKFAASTPRCRKTVINYLYSKGYSQIFLINDIPLKPYEITAELSELNLPFKPFVTQKLGTAFILLPKKNNEK